MLPRSLNLCCCVVAPATGSDMGTSARWSDQSTGIVTECPRSLPKTRKGEARIRWAAKRRTLRAVLRDDVRPVSVGESVRRCLLTNFDQKSPAHRVDVTRIVTCDMAFLVREPAELVMQVVAASSAGHVEEGRFEVLTDGEPPSSTAEVRDPEGATMHIIRTDPGRLTVTYRARIRSSATEPREPAHHFSAAGVEDRQAYERQVYLRPSRYCPSEHLVGFAVAEFGTGPDMGSASAVSLNGYGDESSTYLVRARYMTRRRTRSSPVRELVETSLISGLRCAGRPESPLDLQPSMRRALIQWTSTPCLKHSKTADGTSTIPPGLLQGRPSCALPPAGMRRTLPSLR